MEKLKSFWTKIFLRHIKVRVVSVNPYGWYVKLQGKKLKVVDVNETQYALLKHPDKRIWKSDCEVIEPIGLGEFSLYLFVSIVAGLALTALYLIVERIDF